EEGRGDRVVVGGEPGLRVGDHARQRVGVGDEWSAGLPVGAIGRRGRAQVGNVTGHRREYLVERHERTPHAPAAWAEATSSTNASTSRWRSSMSAKRSMRA